MSARDGHHEVGEHAATDSEHMRPDDGDGVCSRRDPANPRGVCTRNAGHAGQHEAGAGIPGVAITVMAVWSSHDGEVLVSRESAYVALGAAIASGLPFSNTGMAALADLDRRLGRPFQVRGPGEGPATQGGQS